MPFVRLLRESLWPFFGLVWNRWCTSRRFQKSDPCVLCKNPDTRDSIEHYSSCEVSHKLAKYLFLGRNPFCGDYADNLAHLLGIDISDDSRRLDHLIWVFILYTLQNFARASGPDLSFKDLQDLGDRTLFRLSAGKSKVSKTSRELIKKRNIPHALISSRRPRVHSPPREESYPPVPSHDRVAARRVRVHSPPTREVRPRRLE